MSVFKCKMCGGTLEINENQTTAVCDYCGTEQTLPKLDDERRANLYDRANHFRRNNEFDKAISIYENILNEDATDAEAYWSLVLCRYGIEYVEDPGTKKRIPTVNRAQFTSIYDDDNYKSAIANADLMQKTIYESEAMAINEIQKGILAISQKEDPFDVFICYKETDANGRRTQDSVLANDLYHQLTSEGFKVFFSRITLEDKLGVAYEPYIFAALNSAKVMVVIGTKPEYYNAVWVKNEWSRYLTLVKQSGGKKVLIPAYRDMDPYDLPEEFSHLQAQDMSKLGFMQDLIRGIKKLVQNETSKVSIKEVTINSANANTAPLLKRAFMFLEDSEWNNAAEYCEKVLDQDPENAEAYLGKLLSELRCSNIESLKARKSSFEDHPSYKKVIRFADEKLRTQLASVIAHIHKRVKQVNDQEIYDRALRIMQNAKSAEEYSEAAKLFQQIGNYSDAEKKAEDCLYLASTIELARVYSQAKSIFANATSDDQVDKALALLHSIPDYLDVQEFLSSAKGQWEAKKSRFNLLVSSYTHLKESANIASQILDLERSIRQWTKEQEELESLLREAPLVSQSIASYTSELQQRNSTLSELERERSSLGIFAGKRKKEIDAAMQPIQSEINALKAKIDEEKKKLNGYSSANEIETKLRSLKDSILKAEEKREVLNAPVEVAGTEDEIISELLSDNFIHMTLNTPKIASNLLNNSKVLSIIKDNPSIASNLYGIKLPKEMVDKLEGTEDELYFVHKNDKRDESELIEAFSHYYENGLFSGYEIRKVVAPEYFGAHRKCKPINFLFSKNGEDILAVAIVTYSSITHPAVKNVKLECKNRGIKYLRFIVGYPNMEHYVVRRTLEELGEIPCVQK